MKLNNKQRKTLEVIFERPTRANITWADIERLFVALGGDIIEGKGSAIKVLLEGELAYFHRPHPTKEAKRYQVENARSFLQGLRIEP